MSFTAIGIDISKQSFDATLLIDQNQIHQSFENNTQGFNTFFKWMKKHSKYTFRVCMESTGIYSLNLAEFLVKNDIFVSIVNPFQIKAFANTQLRRNKTDKVDSLTIAHFCKLMQPSAWQPTTNIVSKIKALVDRYHSLIEFKITENNHLESCRDKDVRRSIRLMIKRLEKEIEATRMKALEAVKSDECTLKKYKLLVTIPGIATITALNLIAYLPSIESFTHAKQVAAYAGLTPCQKQSGTSVNGKSRISKMGNVKVRKSMYFPAIAAKRCSPTLNAFANRLKENGKSKMQVICAVMRKLLHVVYGVLKSELPFQEAISPTT